MRARVGGCLTAIAWVPHSAFRLNWGGADAHLAFTACRWLGGSACARRQEARSRSGVPGEGPHAATATVEPHYDLVSDKVPFWARFVICAGQLTAIRDEGRALPAPKDELDKLIADYRSRAADLLTYRAKADAKASALDADAEITKVRSGAMQFLPGDVTKIGVETMKKRATERLTFCQLTRDWYEVQNGIRTATPAAEQQKLTRQHDEAMRKTAAEAPKPPSAMPPAIKPSVVQPTTRTAAAPSQPPVPTAKVVVPDAGTTIGGLDMRDIRIGLSATGGTVVVPPLVSGDFSLRPLWSALAECVARMELIQTRTGDSTRVQQEGYARRAAYILWGSRGDVGGKDLGAMAGPVSQERARLGPRVAASWDEHRQRTGQIPNAHWGQVCGALETYAGRRGAARLAGQARAGAARSRRGDEEVQCAVFLVERFVIGRGLRRLLGLDQLRRGRCRRLARRASGDDAALRAREPADPAGDQGDRPEIRSLSALTRPAAECPCS